MQLSISNHSSTAAHASHPNDWPMLAFTISSEQAAFDFYAERLWCVQTWCRSRSDGFSTHQRQDACLFLRFAYEVVLFASLLLLWDCIHFVPDKECCFHSSLSLLPSQFLGPVLSLTSLFGLYISSLKTRQIICLMMQSGKRGVNVQMYHSGI